MSLPFENALQRERERQRRQREGGQHTELSDRMETPTFSPAGVGAPTAPPPAQDISTMTDMVAELTRPVDRAQLEPRPEDLKPKAIKCKKTLEVKKKIHGSLNPRALNQRQ